ncbi:MAG: NAD-dependent epimerase/dehydratase family protein [Gammaproteobacteria bacterium]
MVGAVIRVLVTGSTGFIGDALLAHLDADVKFDAVGSTRSELDSATAEPKRITVGELGVDTDWRLALDRVDTVVHAAARVHVMGDTGADALATYRNVNVTGTLRLAEQARAAGVSRFVFLSSVKVNGESTEPGKPFTGADAPAPVDSYGISKWEAERALAEFCGAAGMELVTIRPTLVYGPGVRANFEILLRFLQRGVPLPLAGVRNQRSMIGIRNLVSLIETCIVSEAAPERVFMAADGEDLSTPELLRRAARAMDCKARLFFAPQGLIRLGARFAGRERYARRLLDSLQVDIGTARSALGWAPPFTVDDELRRTADRYLGRDR